MLLGEGSRGLPTTVPRPKGFHRGSRGVRAAELGGAATAALTVGFLPGSHRADLQTRSR
jgi:hypothetical protein